ncbi:MAG TPA: alpha-L-arabinofuranosidase C-terminal domain-containing protein, partial [Mobilitalea sp.]|nr:alpha-L-arabinofuranosidase C-terminal domain-containing protein [Mobilitalea sp.]
QSIGLEKEYMVPNLHESVSMAADGKVHITLNNLSVSDSYEIDGIFAESGVKSVKGTILKGDMKAYNTFENPNNVQITEFNGCTVTDKGIRFTIPACSVLQLELELK